MVPESRGEKVDLFFQELDRAFLPVVEGVEHLVQAFSVFSKNLVDLQGSLKAIVVQIETLLRGIDFKLNTARQALQSIDLKEIKAEIGDHVHRFQELTQGLILASLNLSIKAQRVEGVQGQVLKELGEEMADFLMAMRRRMDEVHKTLQQSYKELELLMGALSREIAVTTFDELKEMIDYIGDLGLPPVEELIYCSQFHDIIRQEMERIRAFWNELYQSEQDISFYRLGRQAALLEELPIQLERVKTLTEQKLDELRGSLKEVNYNIRTCCHTVLSRVYKTKELAEAINSKVKDLWRRVRTLKQDIPRNGDDYADRSFAREVLMLHALRTQFVINNGQRAAEEHGMLNLIEKVSNDLKNVDQRIVASVTHWQSLAHSMRNIVQELDTELKELSGKLDAHLKDLSGFLRNAREELLGLRHTFSQLTQRCMRHIEEAKRSFGWRSRLILQELEGQKQQLHECTRAVRGEEEFLKGFNSVSLTKVLAEEEIQSSVELF